MSDLTTPTSRIHLRGFASMDPVKRRQICSLAGKAAHACGKAHKWNSLEASEAGKKSQLSGKAHQFNSSEAVIAGRKGGIARAAKRRRIHSTTASPLPH